MAEDWMGQLAAQDQYDNTERDFQHGIRQTPWFSEFQQRFGEEPDLNTPDYNYRAAWAAGARPDVRDPGDNLLHWDSRYKGESHPNRFVNGVDTITGEPLLAPPDERGFQPPPGAFEAAAARVRAPYRNLPAPGSNRIGQLAEQVTSMPSWADVATQQMNKDKEAFQTGGIGSLLADTAVAQELAGGFGGTTKAVGKPVMGALAEVAPPFYSAASRAVDNAKLGKGTADQWLGYLRNQPGVKPEELQYVFGNLPEGQLTKAQMQAHAAENEVRLGEVVKGNPKEAAFMTPDSPGFDPDRIQRANPTKYSQWQLPGGENYRETLLTLPERQTPGSKRIDEIKNRVGEISRLPARETDPRTPQGQALLQEFDRLNAEKNEIIKAEPRQDQFRSSHWDEPNVLAHVRTNDREIPGVGKSLHVEEIQSDWHQKGRTYGYQQPPSAELEEMRALDAIPHNQLTEAQRARGRELMERVPAEERATRNAVPDAPFKSTWADVALKRQIREASEKGYDAISWTPGEAQAARYDLSKHVKEIEYIKRGDKYELGVTDIRGDGVDMPNKAMTLKEIEDTLGKEMAEKISKGEGQKFRGHEGYTLSGLDLKVGGEGMHGFYDKMLVDKANAIGKKHGARVEQTQLPLNNEKKSYAEILDQVGMTSDEWTSLTPSQRSAKLVEINAGKPVHVLRITPELRAAAMKGFPLFTAGGIVAGGTIGELARQDKYGQNE